jgi:hypothetical protein
MPKIEWIKTEEGKSVVEGSVPIVKKLFKTKAFKDTQMAGFETFEQFRTVLTTDYFK